MHMFGDYGMGFGGGGMIMMVLFWGVIIVGGFYLIKLLTGKGQDENRKETAMNILQKRYASGEISTEEYEKIKRDLES